VGGSESRGVLELLGVGRRVDSRAEEAVSLGVLVTMVWFPVWRNIPPDTLTGLDSSRACLASTNVCGLDGGACVVIGLLSCFSGRDEIG
jgi:hypothetical protein